MSATCPTCDRVMTHDLCDWCAARARAKRDLTAIGDFAARGTITPDDLAEYTTCDAAGTHLSVSEDGTIARSTP